MKGLEFLKANANRDALILIVEDAIAKKVIFAWTNLFPKYEDFEADGMALPDVLRIAWNGPTPEELDTLSRIAGLPRRTVEEKVIQLSRARLIFPDGSASDLALKVIEAEISAKLRKMVGPQKKKEEAKREEPKK